MTRDLSNPARHIYASGSIGAGICSTVPSILLLYYATVIMDFPPAAVGIAILIPKFAGLFIDPIVGNWADRLAQGQRWRMLLIIASVVVSASFATLFSAAYFRLDGLTVAAIYGVFTLSYSAFAVPYAAAPVRLETLELKRAQLIGLRLTYGFSGIIIGAAIAPSLVDVGGGGSAGYTLMAFILALIVLVNFSATALLGPAPSTTATITNRSGLFLIHIPLQDAGFARMVVIYSLSTIAFGAFGAGTPFLIKNTLGLSDAMVALAMLACFGAAFVSSPLWTWLLGRFNRSYVIVCGQGLVVIGAVSLAVPSIALFASAAGFAIVGVGFAAIQLTCFAAIADLAALREKTTSAPHAALYTGTWIAFEKLGLAMGAALAGLILQTIKLPLSASLMTSAVPALMCVIATFIAIEKQNSNLREI